MILVLTALLLAAQVPDAVLAKAIEAHKAGNLEVAASAYRDYLKRHPKAFEIRSNLGAVLAQAGHYTEAIEEYRAALRLAPANPGIGYNLALAYYKSGDMLAASKELSTMRALAPDNAQVALLLADCWLQMGENSKVIELLTEREKSHRGDLALSYVLGTALVREGKIEEGQRLLNHIFAKGDSAEARLLMGTAKLNAADFAGALTDFAKAVELNARLPSAHAYYGQALLATGDTPGASVAFKKELDLNANDFNANLNLGVILKQDQEYAAARSHFARALRVRPGDLRVRYQLGTIDLAEGNIEGARQQLESVVAEAPKFVEAHVTLATVYYRLKRKEDGDRERRIVETLNAEIQANQPKGVASP